MATDLYSESNAIKAVKKRRGSQNLASLTQKAERQDSIERSQKAVQFNKALPEQAHVVRKKLQTSNGRNQIVLVVIVCIIARILVWFAHREL